MCGQVYHKLEVDESSCFVRNCMEHQPKVTEVSAQNDRYSLKKCSISGLGLLPRGSIHLFTNSLQKINSTPFFVPPKLAALPYFSNVAMLFTIVTCIATGCKSKKLSEYHIFHFPLTTCNLNLYFSTILFPFSSC